MPEVAIGEFLTPEQGKQVARLWAQHGDSREFVTAVTVKVIRPNLPEINRKLGKDSDPRAIAAVIQHALAHTGE